MIRDHFCKLLKPIPSLVNARGIYACFPDPQLARERVILGSQPLRLSFLKDLSAFSLPCAH